MSNEFTEIAETIGYDNFTASIEDGKFIITPADAGIALFGYIQIAEDQMTQYQEAVEGLREEFEDLRNDNALLRDLLERCYGVLIDAGHVTLADEVIEAAYPIKGIEAMEEDE